jgi:hypothetical protein
MGRTVTDEGSLDRFVSNIEQFIKGVEKGEAVVGVDG